MELLTHRISRRLNSLGFTLRKAYFKISTAKPSLFIVATIVAAFSLFLLAGGIYDILEQPLAAIPFGRSVLFYYPYTLQAQAVVESVGVAIAYAMGTVGLLLMYQSTKYAYKPRQAFMLLLTGMVLMLIAYIYIESLVQQKLFPPTPTTTSSSGQG
jgi:hypothetical protein